MTTESKKSRPVTFRADPELVERAELIAAVDGQRSIGAIAATGLEREVSRRLVAGGPKLRDAMAAIKRARGSS